MTLREALQAKGRTQASLARDLEVSEMTVSGYVLGKRQPSAWRARQIEEALGVPAGSIQWPNPKEASA